MRPKSIVVWKNHDYTSKYSYNYSSEIAASERNESVSLAERNKSVSLPEKMKVSV